jgi:hypothetical protein
VTPAKKTGKSKKEGSFTNECNNVARGFTALVAFFQFFRFFEEKNVG